RRSRLRPSRTGRRCEPRSTTQTSATGSARRATASPTPSPSTPMSDLREILDLYDRLVAVAVGVVPDDAVERAAEVGRAARRRLGYLGDTVLVAFAGGT